MLQSPKIVVGHTMSVKIKCLTLQQSPQCTRYITLFGSVIYLVGEGGSITADIFPYRVNNTVRSDNLFDHIRVHLGAHTYTSVDLYLMKYWKISPPGSFGKIIYRT